MSYQDPNCSNCKNARLSMMHPDGQLGLPGLLYCSRISENPCMEARVPSRNWCSWHDLGAPQKGPAFHVQSPQIQMRNVEIELDHPMVTVPLRLVNMRRANRLRKLLRNERRMSQELDCKYNSICESIQIEIENGNTAMVAAYRRTGDFLYRRCTRMWRRVDRIQQMLDIQELT